MKIWHKLKWQIEVTSLMQRKDKSIDQHDTPENKSVKHVHTGDNLVEENLHFTRLGQIHTGRGKEECIREFDLQIIADGRRFFGIPYQKQSWPG